MSKTTEIQEETTIWGKLWFASMMLKMKKKMDEGKKPAGLDYITMIPYLQAVIKDQERRIAELEKKINENAVSKYGKYFSYLCTPIEGTAMSSLINIIKNSTTKEIRSNAFFRI